MNIEEGIKHVIDGDAILFIGAGFSVGATNLLDEEMKMASKFSEELCNELDMPYDADLSKVSNIYLNEKDPLTLIDKLMDNYKCKSYKNYHKSIATLPWKRIYTTNYDDVFERCSVECSKRRQSYVLSDNVQKVKKEDIILHINGYIDKLNRDSLNNEFKLTSTSYLVEEFTKTSWCELFKSDLKNRSAIFFIGCSFDYDLDLQRIINDSPNIRERVIFIDKELSEEDKNNKYYNYYKKLFGSVENIGVERFAEIIEKVKNEYKVKSQKVKLKCFEEVQDKEYKYENITTQDIWNLLAIGEVKEGLNYYNYDNDNYIVFRNEINQIIKTIEEKDARVIIIHSDLGNGKTCIVEKLKYILMKKGNTFILRKNLQCIDNEIDIIDKYLGKKFIIIENYNHNMEILNSFKPYNNRDYTFILTVRSYINDSVSYKLPSKLNIEESDIYEISVDTISRKDAKSIVKLLNRTELWNEDKKRSTSYKQNKITNRKHWNGHFREMILDTIEKSKVSNRVTDIYKSIEKSEVSKDILLAVFINSIIGLDMSLNEIISYLGIVNIPNNIKKDENLNELIDINDYNIKCKSSIMAKYLINTQNLQMDLMKIINIMNHKANENLFDDDARKIRKALISISNIWEVLNIKTVNMAGIEDEILQYYDSIKDFEEYNDNPYFWLQYAIACIDTKQYERAKNYFMIAYREGKEQGFKYMYEFDTFQIDTQYARYLFENYIYAEDSEEPIKVFEEAHRLLIKSLNSSRGQKHYIFRQVGYYSEFLNKYVHKFNSSNRNIFISSCKNMIDYIDKYMSIERDGYKNQKAKESKSKLEKCIKECYNSVTK